MKDKNLPDDIKNKSLLDLTRLANKLTENLENKKDLKHQVINNYCGKKLK